MISTWSPQHSLALINQFTHTRRQQQFFCWHSGTGWGPEGKNKNFRQSGYVYQYISLSIPYYIIRNRIAVETFGIANHVIASVFHKMSERWPPDHIYITKQQIRKNWQSEIDALEKTGPCDQRRAKLDRCSRKTMLSFLQLVLLFAYKTRRCVPLRKTTSCLAVYVDYERLVSYSRSSI